MTESEIMHCAAILAAGMIARDNESIIIAEEAVEMMEEVAEVIRRSKKPHIDSNYHM